MTARTVTEYRALVQAGTKGLAHLAARRNTGTWVSRCGRQIRSQEIREWQGEDAGVQAVALGDAFCEECGAEAIRTAGTIADGVAILLSLDPADDSAAQLLKVPLDAIGTDGDLRDPGEELVASVAANGVTAPIVARRSPTGLRLVAGGRRLAAARAAGLETIPTIVRDLDDQRTVVDQLLDNLHRQDLDPIAQALAFRAALDGLGITQAELADGLGLSRPHVCNTLRLLALPDYLREEIANGALTAEQGRALLRISDPDEQAEIAARVVAEQLTGRETDAVVRAKMQHREDRRSPELGLIADLLAGVLEARVKVTRTGDRARVAIDVADEDLARLLERLGAVEAVAA